VPRDELTPQARAQLDALDRILARAPVDEEHLELAALVDSVRATAPAMDPAFAARLDAQLRRGPARALRLPRLARRRLALAGGGLVAAAVTLAIVLSSGLLGGAERLPPAVRLPVAGAHLPSAGAHVPKAGAGVGNGSFAAAPSGPARASTGVAAQAPGPTARLVQRSSMLVLASPAAQLQRVASGVIAQTERAGGVVSSSYVNVAGAASRASFTLRVPGAKLPPLIASLAALASVRSLTQDTVDITSGYRTALATIATLAAQRATLERELASAPTSAAAAAITHRLHAVESDLAAQRAAASRLLADGRTATLRVRLGVATAQAHHAGAGAGGGTTLGRAARKALGALEDLLAVALVALAIGLPIALSMLVVWWLWTALRQRARERAIAAS
jgi:hypothetical protein